MNNHESNQLVDRLSRSPMKSDFIIYLRYKLDLTLNAMVSIENEAHLRMAQGKAQELKQLISTMEGQRKEPKNEQSY